MWLTEIALRDLMKTQVVVVVLLVEESFGLNRSAPSLHTYGFLLEDFPLDNTHKLSEALSTQGSLPA